MEDKLQAISYKDSISIADAKPAKVMSKLQLSSDGVVLSQLAHKPNRLCSFAFAPGLQSLQPTSI